MKRRKISTVVLAFVMALSLSVTTFAADLPQTPGTQEEGTVEELTDVQNDADPEKDTVSGEETDPEKNENPTVDEDKDTVNGEQGEPEAQNDAEPQAAASPYAAVNDAWTSADFVYTEMEQTLNGCDYTRQFKITGRAIAGFSESGEAKIATNKDLVLPSVDEDGNTLVGIAQGAFKDRGIETVKFPEGMMVDYDDTVTHVVTRRGNFIIGTEAFAKNNLTSVYLPEGVIAVMPSAFKNNQLTSVSLPHTIWWIENSSFANNNLSTVGFPKTCDFQVQIHAFAFAYNNIKSVRLPDYTEVVEKKVFYWNPGMEACPTDAPEKEQGYGGVVYMYTDNPELANMERIHHIDRTAESQHSWHQKLIVGTQPTEEGAWTVEDFIIEGTTITGLSDSGVAKRKTNKDLVLPDRNADREYITALGDTQSANGLFATAEEGFDSVTLPVRLEKIGMRAFCDNGLSRINGFPSTLKEIGIAAFQTNNLTHINLPDNVTKVGGGAFGTNPKLESIRLSTGLTEIEAGAFGCSDAKNYMENLTELTIPEGITKIGNNAFAGNNIKNIVIPSTVTEIGNYAFSTKNYLTDECTLTLPEGLVTIGSRAFRNKVIKEVELPSTVTKLNKNTFEKEYSDDTTAVKTKVYVSKEQYADKTNFPVSTYHEYALRVDPNDTEWNAWDFTYADWEEAGVTETEVTLFPADDTSKKVKLTPYLVTGLSELGEQKLEKNKNLVIPAADPEGRKVTGVGSKAFYKNTEIESVTFPEGVMVDYEGPEGLLADGVTQRGDFIILKQAFDGCKGLTSVTLPEGVLRIGMYAFRDTMLESVEFPHTIWWVESAAFARSNISMISFEECDFKLNLMQQSFMANKIKAVQLPKRTEFVNEYVFLQNTGMEAISSSAPSTWGASKGYGVVYMYADPEVAKQPLVRHIGTAGSKKSYAQKLITDEEMPEELKPWSANDFTYSEDGATITGLTASGIAKRKTMPKMIMPDTNPDGVTITAIADAPASASYGLFGAEGEEFTSVKLPSQLKRIGTTAFAGNGIQEITFPETLEEIGNYAFRQNNLTEIILPDSVKVVGDGVFASNFTVERVHISSGMTEIPKGFISCSGQVAAEKFTELVIPEGITSIGDNAFAGNNLSKLVIPAGVKSIGGSAFSQTPVQRSLEEIILPEGLESIGRWAFRYAKVTELNLPTTVTTLNKDAFRDCLAAGKQVILYTSNKEQLVDSADGKTFVANSTYHKTVYSNLIGTGWSYDDFVFDGATIVGWSDKGNETRLTNKDLVIPAINPETGEAITKIGDSAFKIPDDEIEQLKDSVNSPNGMNTIIIPETVTEIGSKAFEYNSLKTVDFSGNLTSIGGSAFHGNQLEKIILPDNVTTVGTGAFSENNITELKLSNGLTKIEAGTFSMNIRLEQVEIPNTITEIGDMAFAGARLTSLNIPESVTKIGRKAFHLHHLSELTIPGNVKEIGDSAFEGTFKAITMKNLVLEEGIESIGSMAFKEGYLESVQLPNSLKSLAADAFVNNAGTDNDHVVVCYTNNYEHLKFPASTSHRIVFDSDWDAECFTYDGNVLTGLSEKGQALVAQKTDIILPDTAPTGETITEIAAGAFKDLGLTDVVLPKELKTIQAEAFAGNKLVTVTLPDTMEKIAEDAFAGNEKIVELYVYGKDAYTNLKDTEFNGAVLVSKVPEEKPDPDDNKPGDDNKPNKGGQSGDKTQTGGKKGAVSTGDTVPLVPYAVAAGIAVLAIVAVLVKRRTNMK